MTQTHGSEPNSPHRGILLLAVLAVLLTAMSAQAGLNRWTPLGPGGGRIYALAVDPDSPNILYAAAGQAGVYKSLDRGETWEWSSLGMAGLNIQDVAVAWGSPETLYAATGESESSSEVIFRSTDGGATWEWVFETLYDSYASLQLAAAGDRVYVRTGTHLYRSADNGETWQAIFEGILGGVAVNPQAPDTVYLSTQLGVFRTTDGGNTWFLFPSALDARSVAVAPSRPQRVYFATGTAVYRSDDAGATWTPTAPLPLYIGDLAVDPNDADTVYIYGYAVHVTRDGGLTWERIERGLPRIPSGVEPLLSLAVSPERPGLVYAGTMFDGVYKTENARRWRPTAGTGLSSRRFAWVKAHPELRSVLFAQSDSKLYRSGDSGRTWARVATELDGFGIFDLTFEPRRPSRIYASTGQGLYQSNDGGVSWSRVRGAGFAVRGFVRVDERTLVAAGGFGIFQSTDGGKTWGETLDRSLPPPDDDRYAGRAILWLKSEPAAPRTIYALASDYIIHGTGSSYLVRSTDGGATWRLLRYFPVLEIAPGRPRTLYASDYQQVFRSLDGGNTWEALSPLAGVTDLEVDPRVPTTIYAATSVAGVFRSTDGGVSWFPINAGLARLGRRFITDIEVHPSVPGLLYAVPLHGGLFEARFTQ